MKKIINLKHSMKKDISLFLFIIYILHLTFMIFVNNKISIIDSQIFKYVYMFRIHRWILSFPIIYYFVKTYKKYEYFKTNEKFNIKDFNTYFALAFYVGNLSNLLIVSMFKFKGRTPLINEPLYIDVIMAVFVAPILEEIVFRGVIMNDLKKYSYKVAIVINSILFGLMHYNINNTGQYIVLGIIFSYIAYKYSLKYSILLHILCNIPSVMSIIFYINRDSYSTEALLSYSGLLVIILFLFLILGLIRKKYKEIFSIFKLNNEDRKNIAEFVKNNGLYLFVILVIVISNLLFNYKLF